MEKKNLFLTFAISLVIFSCSKEVILPKYTLSVSSNPSIGGSVSPSSGTYEEGITVSITATPQQDYLFNNWSGSYSGTENPLNLQMMRNENLIANFSNQPDSDGDGIPNYRDSEPNTRAGVPVDASGKMENPIYLADNGVTVKAKDWARIGDVGKLDGVEFKIVGSILNLDSGKDIICTTLISDLGQYMLKDIGVFDKMETWDVSNVTSMESLFYGISLKNKDGKPVDLSKWDTRNVKNMRTLFTLSDFNGDISDWNVSNVTDMFGMFSNTPFNQDISKWNVGKVENMDSMFPNSSFNQDLSSWDVSNVKNMVVMFADSKFNQDISKWNVSKVTNMNGMFINTPFNQDVSNWDVRNVTNMGGMFYNTPFNQNISNWNVGNVISMYSMFSENESFNQDLSQWNVSKVTRCENFNNGTLKWILPKPNFTNCTP